jgi:DNA-binding response OmpR family regulator/HPt (histidine-containing phosphotransfer) domain-containing protein
MRLLVIEDDPSVGGLIAAALRGDGHRVDVFESAADGLEALRSVAYDLLIVDRALPDQDGIQVVRALRAQGGAMPVLMLTARGSIDDRVAGLEAGADDYLIKPFAMPELKARLHALARRPARLESRVLALGRLRLEAESRVASVDGRDLRLSRREFALLELLLRRPGQLYPRSAIEQSLYGFDEEVASNAVEVHVHHLRKMLARSEAGVRIETRRGIGYSIVELPDDDEALGRRAIASQAAAFRRRLAEDRGRFDALLAGGLADGGLAQAAAIAHKLAGAAGQFGEAGIGAAALAFENAAEAATGPTPALLRLARDLAARLAAADGVDA